jgi:uncharacterized membrane-anchored protein
MPSRGFRLPLLALAVLIAEAPALGQQQDSPADQIGSLDWVDGPIAVDTVGNAVLQVPKNYMFLYGPDTEKLSILMENPPSGRTENFIAPGDFAWGAYLSFDDVGYVKDDEKIDADAILADIKAGTAQANEERKKRGWEPLEVVGWRYPPYYDSQTHRLVWAIQGKASNEFVINYNTRILGRKGVTSATLVVAPEDLEAAVPRFNAILEGYEFKPGGQYAEYRQGDRIAEYGLAALIVGGTAAVVAKSTGLLKVV